jgi:glycosyltransferase involved in cell wall biosynthesis
VKVLVDVTTWCPGRTGVGLYTEHVLRSWLALGQDELILATNTDDREFVEIAAQKIGPRMPIRAVWMQTALALQAAKLKPDAAFFPNYMAPLTLAAGLPRVPYVVTVHDLAIFLYPETFTFKKRVLQRLLLPTLARGAAAILTPSEATRRDVLRILPVRPENVVAVPLAADARFHTPPDALTIARERQNLQLPQHFLLAVGTLEPRKNLVRLIEAFEHIAPAHPDVHLVLAGGRGWKDEGIARTLNASRQKDRIHPVGYVSPDALKVLYHEAIALCYPSLYEGFGLPVVEAMASGAPVLTSRGSSLDEVADGAAIAVDPLQVEEIAHGMTRLIEDTALRQNLRHRGLARAAELSWQKTAEATREVFVRVVGERR